MSRYFFAYWFTIALINTNRIKYLFIQREFNAL